MNMVRLSIMLRWGALTLPVLVVALNGCCRTDECCNKHSGIDGERPGAPRIRGGMIYNDEVSWDKRDCMDWRHIMLAQQGTLTVLLHWDNGKAKLNLDVFDAMGIKIQEGRVWGSGGLRAVVAIEEPGPYYIRVRTVGTDDESHYSLRVLFKPGGPPPVCHNCTVGERKCLGAASYVTCERVAPGCTAWTKEIPCPNQAGCKNGVCDPCASPCTPQSQRCVSAKAFAVCAQKAGDPCPSWGPAVPCPAGFRCREDQCRKAGPAAPRCTQDSDCPANRICRAGRCVERAATPAPAKSPRCKIISLYRYRGVWTLHLECPDEGTAKPGQVGTVLDGDTNKPLPGGQIKVLRVAGRYAIANTSLSQLGKNRWVLLEPR